MNENTKALIQPIQDEIRELEELLKSKKERRDKLVIAAFKDEHKLEVGDVVRITKMGDVLISGDRVGFEYRITEFSTNEVWCGLQLIEIYAVMVCIPLNAGMSWVRNVAFGADNYQWEKVTT